jgi:hypothetical protein
MIPECFCDATPSAVLTTPCELTDYSQNLHQIDESIILRDGCPVKSRIESTGCRSYISHFGFHLAEVPVKWEFFRKW